MSQGALVVGVGASAGLGGALCRRFAREGLHAFPAGRTRERVESVAAGIRRDGLEATAVVADTTLEADVVAAFDAVDAETGPPALVVYNAGNAHMQPLVETEARSFEDVWRVGCLGGFLVGREAARRMVPAGGGTLLFTGATASVRHRPPFTAFASAKAALRALAFAMAREFGPRGLHVGHVVIDGMIAGDQLLGRFPELRERAREDGMLALDAIADAYWALHRQQRSAWSLELDLRPFSEEF